MDRVMHMVKRSAPDSSQDGQSGGNLATLLCVTRKITKGESNGTIMDLWKYSDSKT